MIQIKNRSKEPAVLTDNKQDWKRSLNEAIVALEDFILSKGGFIGIDKTSFKKLPSITQVDIDMFSSLKDRLEKAFEFDKSKKSDIQEAVKQFSTKNKCVYCEKFTEDREGDIEHYYPKSLYPLLTFEWNNLFWTCQSCNRFEKNNHDTYRLPIVHPEKDNPELFFEYDNAGFMMPTSKDIDKAIIAKRTLEVLGLEERSSLNIERFNAVRLPFEELEESIKLLLEDYLKDSSIVLLKRLYDRLKYQQGISNDSKAFVGYHRFLLRQSPIIQEAITKINEKYTELGLSNPFELY